MTVWCGQCQTKNEGDVDRCVRCGAPLRPEFGRPIRLVASPSNASRRGLAAPRIERYDPRWLQRLVEEQYPEGHDLQVLVGRCRNVVRVEGIEEGEGQRVYFLPERPNRYVSAPEDVYTFRAPGWTIELVTVKDQMHTTRKAVHYVQTTATPSQAPIEVRMAQYKQLCGDRRALQLQFLLIPLLVTVLDILVVSFVGVLPGVGAAPFAALLPKQLALFCAVALNAYVAVLTKSLATALHEQQCAVADLELANQSVPTSGVGYSAPGRVARSGANGWPGRSHGLLGLMVATSLIMLWLLIRVAVLDTGDMARWEPPLVMLVALTIYPLGSLLRTWWRQLALRRAQLQLLRATQTGGECRFEPWLEQSH